MEEEEGFKITNVALYRRLRKMRGEEKKEKKEKKGEKEKKSEKEKKVANEEEEVKDNENLVKIEIEFDDKVNDKNED